MVQCVDLEHPPQWRLYTNRANKLFSECMPHTHNPPPPFPYYPSLFYPPFHTSPIQYFILGHCKYSFQKKYQKLQKHKYKSMYSYKFLLYLLNQFQPCVPASIDI